ncbi:MAG: hypothetical protein M0Z30_11240 [Actinomycetota bacterium]|nr:hypothetical protein [Actinomycetota bacterium]
MTGCRRAAAVLKSFSVSVDPTGALTGGIDVDAAPGLADQHELHADLTDLLLAVVFKFLRIGNLDDVDARAALLEPAQAEGAEYSEGALDLAVEVTGGYPYFLQEMGYAVWGVAEGPTITREDIATAVPTYEAKLDESFFRVRLDRATEMESIYLRAMAELGPEAQKAQDVATVIGRKSTQVAPTRAQLINMGLLYTPEHGYAAFTVPHFDKFLMRAIPELIIPPERPARSRRKT